MFIFYAWEPFRPIGYFRKLGGRHLDSRRRRSLATIEADWRLIQALEIEGSA